MSSPHVDLANELINVAMRLDEAEMRRPVLEAAQLLLRNGEGSPAATGSERHESSDRALPIFRTYKGRQYNAELLVGKTVRYGGKLYGSPSAAAMEITGSQVNGWRFWCFRDATGRQEVIDRVRARYS